MVDHRWGIMMTIIPLELHSMLLMPQEVQGILLLIMEKCILLTAKMEGIIEQNKIIESHGDIKSASMVIKSTLL